MMKYAFAMTFLVLFSGALLADIGHFDIYEIKWHGKKYYLTLESPGILKDNDLCYYDFKGDYKMEVEDFIDESLKRNIQVFVYTEIVEVLIDSLRRSDNTPVHLESPIYVMKGWTPIPSDSIKKQYELLGAKKGHTFGIDSSQNITKEDNQWINRSSMKHSFSVDNGECGYNFYSSQIESGSQQASELKNELQDLMPRGEGEIDIELAEERERLFRERIEELVKDKIFMIGACSC